MRLTYREAISDPDYLDAVLSEARRERARAVHEYLVAPLARLFKREATLEVAHPVRRPAPRTAYC